jgi:hypothetical protein
MMGWSDVVQVSHAEFLQNLRNIHGDFFDQVLKEHPNLFGEGVNNGRSVSSSVVAKQDSVYDQFISGQINALESIDELVASGMDYEEADHVVQGWIEDIGNRGLYSGSNPIQSSSAKLFGDQVPQQLYDLTQDVPLDVADVLYLVTWKDGTGGSVVSGYGIRLKVSTSGSRDSLSAVLYLTPSFGVDALKATFKKSDGTNFPFSADLVANHDIDAKRVVDALCVDAPFEGVFALVDRVCRGMLDGGVDGADVALNGIRKVPDDIVGAFIRGVDKKSFCISSVKDRFLSGKINAPESVNELVFSSIDREEADRVVQGWLDDLKKS